MKTEITSVTTRPHPISNTFHLIMTICTGGLWLPIWILMARGHKETTRLTIPGASPAVNAETKAATEPEIGWGTQMMRDMVAAGSTRTEAAKAVADEMRRQRLGG